MKMPLTICTACNKSFVTPVLDECHETPKGWRMTLRCANCNHERVREVSQREADRFDTDLDELSDELEATLKQVERERFKEEGRRFIAALQLDAILPEDFRV